MAGKDWSERESIEACRESDETLHIADFSSAERADIGDSIARAVAAAASDIGVEVTVEEIHVFGSFASGDALPMVSDLDARIVLSGTASEPELRALETRLKNIGRQYLSEYPIGYLDAVCTAERVRPSEGGYQLY